MKYQKREFYYIKTHIMMKFMKEYDMWQEHIIMINYNIFFLKTEYLNSSEYNKSSKTNLDNWNYFLQIRNNKMFDFQVKALLV